MRPDGQGEANVGNRVTNVIEVGAEPASDVQLGGQNPIEVVHEIVENDQWDHVLVAILEKKNRERQDPKQGRRIGQIPISEICDNCTHDQAASAPRTKK
jgi:hypothetical protein